MASNRNSGLPVRTESGAIAARCLASVACSRSEAIDRRSIGLGNDLATRSRRTLGVQKVVGYSDGNDSASSFEVEAPRPCEPTSQAFSCNKKLGT